MHIKYVGNSQKSLFYIISQRWPNQPKAIKIGSIRDNLTEILFEIAEKSAW